MNNSINNGFDKAFVAKYEDIRNKTLVADKVTNFRLESNLKMGKTVSRWKLDLSKVRVRTENRYQDRTLDTISDSEELITVDQEKYLGFPMHKNDKLQNGPLKAGEEAGKQMAIKAHEWLDGFFLSKSKDAYDTFDDGDIGGTDGNPVDFNTTNIPKIITLAPAKLRSNRVDVSSNLCYVLDSFALANIQQLLIGKDIDLAGSTFKNGYSGTLLNADMYVSDSLTFYADLGLATNPTANDTVTIGGVVFKFVASVGTTAGNVLIGAAAADSLANLVAAINGASGAGTTYIELSDANRIKLSEDLRSTATAGTGKISLVCVGAGRVVVAETFTSADTWSKNRLSAYFGKKKQIDAIMQREVNLDVRQEPKQPVDNHFVDFLAGAKVFDDAKQNFMELWIKA
jgi:hypothetical protein